MQFLSDDGGESYNLCHCKLLRSLLSPLSPVWRSRRQSGATLKSEILTSGGVKHILNSLTTSMNRADFIMRWALVFVRWDSPTSFGKNSVGEMHRFIASALHCSQGRIRSTSSMTSGIGIIPTSTVHRELRIRRDDVGAILLRILVCISVPCWITTDARLFRLWLVFLPEEIRQYVLVDRNILVISACRGWYTQYSTVRVDMSLRYNIDGAVYVYLTSDRHAPPNQ